MCPHVFAENRVALVIGNSTYQHVPVLPNPGNDASDLAAKLRELGFDVVVGLDLDLAGVRKAVRVFAEKLDSADLAMFYYAGHGLQVNGQNYIVPTDAKLASYIDLDFEALPLDIILSAMERTSRVNLVFLDACRDNPLAMNLARSMGTRSGTVGRGLAKVGGGIGTLIAFATQPGNVAFDGAGRNSPFTGALLRHLGKPGRDITRELIDVRRDVLEITAGRQVPWDSSSLTGEVILKPHPPSEQAGEGLQRPSDAAEIAFWETIKTSDNRAGFDAYLSQFPNGTFAALARTRVQQLDQEALKPDVEQPEPELARSLQKELNRLGCNAGREDGRWGAGSRRALDQFKLHAKSNWIELPLSNQLLDRLRGEKIRTCPLVCRSPQKVVNGHCVANAVPKRSLEPERPSSGLERRNQFANCPADADSAFRETFARGSGAGRTVRTGTHSCGREFVCNRRARGRPWTCSWSS